jgi:hypothetical protein
MKLITQIKTQVSEADSASYNLVKLLEGTDLNSRTAIMVTVEVYKYQLQEIRKYFKVLKTVNEIL